MLCMLHRTTDLQFQTSGVTLASVLFQARELDLSSPTAFLQKLATSHEIVAATERVYALLNVSDVLDLHVRIIKTVLILERFIPCGISIFGP